MNEMFFECDLIVTPACSSGQENNDEQATDKFSDDKCRDKD